MFEMNTAEFADVFSASQKRSDTIGEKRIDASWLRYIAVREGVSCDLGVAGRSIVHSVVESLINVSLMKVIYDPKFHRIYRS